MRLLFILMAAAVLTAMACGCGHVSAVGAGGSYNPDTGAYGGNVSVNLKAKPPMRAGRVPAPK